MNPPCARCKKTVYPVEKLNCLDKVSDGRQHSRSGAHTVGVVISWSIQGHHVRPVRDYLVLLNIQVCIVNQQGLGISCSMTAGGSWYCVPTCWIEAVLSGERCKIWSTWIPVHI